MVHVAYIGKHDMHTNLWSENLKEKDYLGDVDVDVMIIIK